MDSSLASGINPTFRLVLNGSEFNNTIKDLVRNKRFKNLNVLSGFTKDDGSFKLAPYFDSKTSPKVNLTLAKRTMSELYSYFPQKLIQASLINYLINTPKAHRYQTILKL